MALLSKQGVEHPGAAQHEVRGVWLLDPAPGPEGELVLRAGLLQPLPPHHQRYHLYQELDIWGSVQEQHRPQRLRLACPGSSHLHGLQPTPNSLLEGTQR